MQEAPQSGKNQFGLRMYVPFVIFIAMLFLIPRIEAWIGVGRIQEFITTAGIWAPLTFVGIRIVTIVISPLMLGPLAILANRAFGFWPAMQLNFIAQMIGASINYWLGRLLGDRFLKFFLGKKMAAQAETYAHKYLTKNTVATGLLLYGYNYELVAYACGIARVPFRRFVVAQAAAASVSVPLLVWQSISIGDNNLLAVGLNIAGYVTAFGAIWYVAGADIKAYVKREMARAKTASQEDPAPAGD